MTRSATMADELRMRASQYDAMAARHATVTFDERRALDTAEVRHLNNFVKSCMIDATCRSLRHRQHVGIRVMDVAAGRGQDHSKWMYGAGAADTVVTSYHGMDLSSADTEAARTMADRYLSKTAEVSIETGDMGVDPWNCPDLGVDAVSCQLAIHYLCDQEAHVRHFMRECVRVLDPAGVVLLSFADGRSVVRRGRDAGGRVRSRFYQLDIPLQALTLKLQSPFGHRYVFTMPGSVEGVPEYLCHEGVLVGIAKENGLVAGISMYFDDMATRFCSHPRFAQIGERMGGNGMQGPNSADALDPANLYRFLVLAKSPQALQFLQSAMSS